MVSMPEPVIKMIKQSDTHKVLATVSPDGKPHAIVCASLWVKGDDTIVLGEVFMQRTAMYLQKNPNAEFLVWLGRNAYSIKAVLTERKTEGVEYDKMSAYLDKFDFTTVAVWEFKVLEVWDESASKTGGTQVI